MKNFQTLLTFRHHRQTKMTFQMANYYKHIYSLSPAALLDEAVEAVCLQQLQICVGLQGVRVCLHVFVCVCQLAQPSSCTCLLLCCYIGESLDTSTEGAAGTGDGSKGVGEADSFTDGISFHCLSLSTTLLRACSCMLISFS